MIEHVYQNGGYDIGWEIEHFSSLLAKKNLKSPTFIFGSLKEEWNLCVYKTAKSFECCVESICKTSQRGNVYFIVCVSWQDETHKESGFISFSSGKKQYRTVILRRVSETIFSRKKFNFRCYLRDISDISTSVKFIRLRSVIETEYQRQRCVIPEFTSLSLEKMHFKVLSTCKSSHPLVVEIHRESYDSVVIYLTEYGNIYIFAHCKISFEDSQGKVLQSVVFYNELHGSIKLQKGVTELIEKGDNVLCLNCEFLVFNDKEPISWVEESYIVPVWQIQNEKRNAFVRKCSMICFLVFVLFILVYLLTKLFYKATRYSAQMYCNSKMIESSGTEVEH